MLRLVLSALALLPLGAHADPLPSWNDTHAKTAIVAFVEGVTDADAVSYVTPADRIAVFDNDGTLWSEQPIYFQVFYAFDRLAELAEADPSILTSDTLRAAAEGDMETALSGGEEALLEIITATHSGLSVEAFQADVADWLNTATHPETGLPFDAMVYQPMLELLSYLRDNGFSTHIVSGGGIHFMRVFAEQLYGIPTENVIGSAGNTSYEVIDGVPTVRKDPGILFIDDKGGKPVGIDTHIGKRPILVAGNSDGDFQMLEWTTAGDGPRLGMLIHHTDGTREYAYDRDGHVGVLDRGLDEAADRNWLIVDMAADWGRVWPAE